VHDNSRESTVVNQDIFGNNALIMEQSATSKRREALVPLLKDAEGEVSAAAAAALERLEGLQSLNEVIEQLKKGSLAAKVRAIYALAEIGGEKVISPLVYCAGRPEEELKGAAIDALGTLAHRSTLQVLVERLKDENSGIQARAIKALGNFRDPVLVPVLLPFLDAGDGLTDVEAIIALSRIDNGSLEGRFIELTRSPSAATRVAAATALGLLKLV
jgi:HEAT repeat protein